MALSLIVAAALIKTVVGLECSSNCAACWKTGSPGVDIKFSCAVGNCNHKCPEGYEGLHCAKVERCQYVGLSRSGNQCL